jgi:hypothetical protein
MKDFDRYWAEGPVGVAGEHHVLQTGIGRAFDPDWITSFVDEFKDLVPSHFRLAMRRVPGAVYLSGEEFDKIQDRAYAGEPSEDAAVKEIRARVASMCIRSVLEPETAQDTIPVKLTGKGVYAKHRKHAIRIVAEIEDLPTDFYPSGFLLTGEQIAVNQDINVRFREQQASTRAVPIKTIGLGTVYSRKGPVPKSLMEKITENLSSKFELGPVDVTRLSH